jgi:hypothetical protein
MTEEIYENFKEGFLDALRLFAALFSAPFVIGREFMMRPPGEPFRWPPDVGQRQ